MKRGIGWWIGGGLLILVTLLVGVGVGGGAGAASSPTMERGAVASQLEVCASAFQDVPPGYPDGDRIACVTAQCIMTGYACGGPGEPCVPPLDQPYFRPAVGASPLRGAVAGVIALGAAYNDAIPSDQQTFEDVPPSDPNWLAIERVHLHGVLDGFVCGGPGEPCGPTNRPYFRPNSPLSRAVFAQTLSTAAGFNDPPPSASTFADVQQGSPYWLAVERVAAHGAMAGTPCGGPGEPCDPANRPYFHPNVNLDLSRAGLARALARAFLPQCPLASATATVTPSVTRTTPPRKTATPTITGTPPTPPPTPALCYDYRILAGQGVLVPGTTRVDGAGCDDCSIDLVLPFPYRLYQGPGLAGTSPQGYPIMRLSADGKVKFGGGGPAGPAQPDDNVCLPAPGETYTIYPHWDDLRTNCACCGIYTGVSGVAPDRVFNVEWRAEYYDNGGNVHFELRLYENAPRFDVIYERADEGGSGATIGVQRDPTQYTEYSCNVPGSVQPDLQLSFIRSVCGAPTYTPTATGTPVQGTATPTRTAAPFCPAPTPCTIQFSDVPVGQPFYPYVRCLVCRGIISGYGDGTFAPYNTVTRGQLCKIVANAAGNFDVVNPLQQTFTDVPSGNPFWAYIERLVGRGIISGYGDGTFRPYNTVTRSQGAKIAANAALYSIAIPSNQQSFEDVPPADPFWVYIERVNEQGVISGYACGGPGEPCVPPLARPYYRPGNTVTRGQTTKIVANTFYPGCQTPAR